MNKQKWLMLLTSLVLMAATGALLTQLRAKQELGAPGVKTSPLAGSRRLQVDLPERVLDYTSEAVPVDKMVLDTLPQDTSFGQRRYEAPGFTADLSVVLMGSDRTSLHKPQFCLEGAGWHIDSSATAASRVAIARPYAYELPVIKLIATKEGTLNGKKVLGRRVYVYWYAADGLVSGDATGFQRMWWMARDLLSKGVLQRWAYVTCSSVCLPGQEDATFERLKEFIAAAVPEFEMPPRPAGLAAAATVSQ